MILDSNKSRKKDLLKDLWSLFWIQLLSLLLGTLFFFLFSVKGLIPDYPQWDNIHLLCGGVGLTFFVIFAISMLFGGYKIMDINFMPRVYRFYAVSTWLYLPFLFVLWNFCELVSASLAETIFAFLFCIFPFYNIVFLLVICCWLGKKLKNFRLK